MAAGGIPQSEIFFWFTLRGRTPERALVDRITALDRVYLVYQAKKKR
jgi:hypothetical protein